MIRSAFRSTSALAMLCGLAGFFSTSAFAGTYECPDDYSEAECEIDSTPVCTIDGDFLICYMADEGVITVVHGYQDNGSGGDLVDDYDYDAWGYFGDEETHTKFCCNFDDDDADSNEVTVVKVRQTYASDDDDTFINFRYDESSVTYNLQPAGSQDMEGIAEGGTGDDTIDGSNADSGDNYSEKLRGGNDNDKVYGNDGDDFLESGPGNTRFDNDELYGGAGDDILAGGEGVDTIDGGHGDDAISGGAEDDFLDGGEGADSICGDQGQDQLKAGDTANGSIDRLWGQGESDVIYCQSSETLWSVGDNGQGACDEEYELFARPAACP